MWQMRSIGPCLLALVLVVQASLATQPDRESAAPVTRTVQIGTPVKSSNVPDAWRQGLFLQTQNVPAVDVSDDCRLVGVTTMAFRQALQLLAARPLCGTRTVSSGRRHGQAGN